MDQHWLGIGIILEEESEHNNFPVFFVSQP